MITDHPFHPNSAGNRSAKIGQKEIGPMVDARIGSRCMRSIFLSMKTYMLVESGATRPIHIHTMKMFTSLEMVGRGLIDLFKEKNPRGWKFEDWISYGSDMKVFEFEADTKLNGKLLKGPTVWKMICKDPALHPDVASVMLQTSK